MVENPVLMQFLNGISFVSILLLVALGLAVIFGLMGIINMAHGEFFMIGAYTAFATQKYLGLNLYFGIIFAFVAVSILGVAIELSLIRRLYERPLETILATWGLSIVLQQSIRLTFGSELQYVATPISGTVELLGINYSAYRLFILMVTIALTIGTYLLFVKTNFGMKVRAITQNREMASALGINTRNVYLITFAVGAGLAGVAGAMISPIKNISPFIGLNAVVDAFMVVIFGGAGRFVGVLGSSIFIGQARSIISYFEQEVTSKILLLALIVVVLRFKPEGLFSIERR